MISFAMVATSLTIGLATLALYLGIADQEFIELDSNKWIQDKQIWMNIFG